MEEVHDVFPPGVFRCGPIHFKFLFQYIRSGGFVFDDLAALSFWGTFCAKLSSGFSDRIRFVCCTLFLCTLAINSGFMVESLFYVRSSFVFWVRADLLSEYCCNRMRSAADFRLLGLCVSGGLALFARIASLSDFMVDVDSWFELISWISSVALSSHYPSIQYCDIIMGCGGWTSIPIRL